MMIKVVKFIVAVLLISATVYSAEQFAENTGK